MNLDRVTITGADDSVAPEALLNISAELPFVEWGILVSAKRMGTSRFPSINWLQTLRRLAFVSSLDLSLHLCGQWVRDLLLGTLNVPEWILDPFRRVQLNFHAEKTSCDPVKFADALRKIGDMQIIFQIDGEDGNKHLQSIYHDGRGIDAVGLFDLSGGAGVLPDHWPEPYFMQDDVSYAYTGYAGGLGPDNLEEQLPRIAEAARDSRIWIDMETRVRSSDDRQFDLAKVRKCLEICKPFVNRRNP